MLLCFISPGTFETNSYLSKHLAATTMDKDHLQTSPFHVDQDTFSKAFTPAPESMWKEQILMQTRMLAGTFCKAEKAEKLAHDTCPDFTDGSFPNCGPCELYCDHCYYEHEDKEIVCKKTLPSDRVVHWIGNEPVTGTTTLLNKLKVTMDKLIDARTQKSTDTNVRKTEQRMLCNPIYGTSFEWKGSKVSWTPSSLFQERMSIHTRCEAATFSERFGFEPSAKRPRKPIAHELTAQVQELWSVL